MKEVLKYHLTPVPLAFVILTDRLGILLISPIKGSIKRLVLSSEPSYMYVEAIILDRNFYLHILNDIYQPHL